MTVHIPYCLLAGLCYTYKHSSLDEKKEHEDQRNKGQMKIATCWWSVYVLYEMHDILTLEKGDEVKGKPFRRLQLAYSLFRLV